MTDARRTSKPPGGAVAGLPHRSSSPLGDPVVESTAAVADTVLAPTAAAVAASRVPRSHLDALGAAGALGTAVYEPTSGATAPQVQREVSELVAAADGATWCVFAQHHHPLREVAACERAEVRERWYEPMAQGRILAAVATSHLRRAGPPPVTAVRRGGQWVLRGRLSWLTGWSLADVVLVGARTDDGRVLFALLDCTGRAGIEQVREHELWSMRPTYTVSAVLADVSVPNDRVLALRSLREWQQTDALRRPNVNPGVFGTIAAAVRHLTRSERPETRYEELGHRWEEEAAALRATAYRLLDEVAPQEGTAERLAVRAAALELACRAATACVAMTGGSGLSVSSAPSRLVAEAHFHLVQAQTSQSRAATAEHLLQSTEGVERGHHRDRGEA